MPSEHETHGCSPEAGEASDAVTVPESSDSKQGHEGWSGREHTVHTEWN